MAIVDEFFLNAECGTRAPVVEAPPSTEFPFNRVLNEDIYEQHPTPQRILLLRASANERGAEASDTRASQLEAEALELRKEAVLSRRQAETLRAAALVLGRSDA